MKSYILSIAIILSSFSLWSQTAIDSAKVESKKETKPPLSTEPQKGDIYFSPVPVFGANPAFGFIFGVGASTSLYWGEPKTTHLSNILAGIAYSTRKQLVLTIKSSVYTPDDDWILLGDWRYLNSSQPTFGLGTGPQSAKLVGTGFEYNDNAFSKPLTTAQMMAFQFIRFYETALKKVNNSLYIGVGFHVDAYSRIKDNLVDLSAIPPVITSNYAYNVKYGFNQTQNTLVGLSANAIYDTRDNQNCPYSGRYAYGSFKVNPEFLGSSKSSSTLWLEYRDYFNFTDDHHNILGFWAFGNFNTSGTLPYMDLPAIAWDQFAKSGRGYVQGRFRGQNLIYTELEYRKHLFSSKKNPDFMGMVLFTNMTTASSTGNNIELFQYMELGYGIGLRLMMSKKARSNVDFDYGFGKYGSHGFYIRLNETF